MLKANAKMDPDLVISLLWEDTLRHSTRSSARGPMWRPEIAMESGLFCARLGVHTLRHSMRFSARGPMWSPDIAMETGIFFGLLGEDTLRHSRRSSARGPTWTWRPRTSAEPVLFISLLKEDKGGHPFFMGTVALSLIRIPRH